MSPVKTISSPRPWPPEACDEIRQNLTRYGWSKKRRAVVDALHAITDELGGWLADERSYERETRRQEWASLIEDVNAADDLIGVNLRALLPTFPTLLAQLHDRLGPDRGARDALVPVLEQVLAEVQHQDAPAAAFDDVVSAVRDLGTLPEVIAGRVDVLDSVLQFAGRSLFDTTRALSGILNNDALEVATVRHILQCGPLPDVRTARNEPDAGLSEDERVALARRWLGQPPPPAHHVVWLFYGNARAGGWRFEVGPCEFFEGSALLGVFEDVDRARAAGEEYPGDRDAYNTPPVELQVEGARGEYLRKSDAWPTDENWVAVRVDLGRAYFPDVVQAARDQVQALIALAAFDRNGTSWVPITGYKCFQNGEEAGSSYPFARVDSEKWVITDHTHSWLQEHGDELGTHLIAGPEGHAVVQAAAALATTPDTSPSVRLLEAVRVIETQASILGIHWKDVINDYINPADALFHAKTVAYRAVERVSGSDELRGLQRLADEFITHDGSRMTINVAAATDRLPTVAVELPDYNRDARYVREVAADLATPAAVADLISRTLDQDARMVRRLHRVRNSLTHGGPVNAVVLESAAEFVAPKAKHITGVALRALLNGAPAEDALTDHRKASNDRVAAVSAATDICEALYGSRKPDGDNIGAY